MHAPHPFPRRGGPARGTRPGPTVPNEQPARRVTGRGPPPPPPPERRDDWQRAPDIFAAAGLRAGSRVADLGAGEGWLTTRLARHVGPGGRVFAADISERALQSLGEALGDSTGQVELVLSEADDPRLPYGTLDAVIVVNAYHEFVERVAVLDGVKRALKPGGLLVIVDAAPSDTVLTRREQAQNHTLAPAFARDDLEAHGFEIVSVQPEFVLHKHDTHTHRQWLISARKRIR
ncbi:MAG: class I SAM-dependent methyltransferase [Gemmatimonadaceae bacterium]